MNRFRARGQLLRLTGAFRQAWGSVINDQTMRIRGERERLLGRMQMSYGAPLAVLHSRRLEPESVTPR
jgi:uncharacterized protein YjbJ (UPF0337 family)